jgi:hypothetical protein
MNTHSDEKILAAIKFFDIGYDIEDIKDAFKKIQKQNSSLSGGNSEMVRKKKTNVFFLKFYAKINKFQKALEYFNILKEIDLIQFGTTRRFKQLCKFCNNKGKNNYEKFN